MDRARNAIAQTAAQIRSGHWRSAVYFKRTRKRKNDGGCWFLELSGAGGELKVFRRWKREGFY
jgi:hypothetical protein